MSQIFKASSGGGTIPPTVPEIFITDVGSATPVANQINLKATATAGASVSFNGSGNIINLFTTDNKINTFIGLVTGNTTLTGTNNNGFGQSSLAQLTTGIQNAAFASALASLTTGSSNTALGTLAGNNLVSGSNNILIGTNSGTAYNTSESSNILIGNVGITGESNVIRIGQQGLGLGQQAFCFLAGVLNTSSGRVVKVTRPPSYPYLVVFADEIISVDTSATANTINLPLIPTQGTRFTIKDRSANASVNNITISGNGSNIVGSTIALTLVLSTNGAAVTLVFDTGSWMVI